MIGSESFKLRGVEGVPVLTGAKCVCGRTSKMNDFGQVDCSLPILETSRAVWFRPLIKRPCGRRVAYCLVENESSWE